MVLAVKPTKTQGPTITYKCANHYQHPDECEHHNNIGYNTLKEIVTLRIKEFFKLMSNDEIIDKLIKEKSSNNDIDNNLINSVNKNQDRLNDILKITRKLYEDYILKKIDEDTYDRLLGDYQKEQKIIQQKIMDSKNILDNRKDIKSDINKLQAVINEVIDFTDLTEEIVFKLISRIDVDYAREVDGIKVREIKITYRFIDITL